MCSQHKSNPSNMPVIFFTELGERTEYTVLTHIGVWVKTKFSMFFCLRQSVQDTQFLANELQLYYATDNAERQQLLKTFNHNQEQFKHTDVIEQLQKTTFELPTSTSSEKGS